MWIGCKAEPNVTVVDGIIISVSSTTRVKTNLSMYDNTYYKICAEKISNKPIIFFIFPLKHILIISKIYT